ncbi:MAG: ABC transporter ATP-binding protein [Planctomycetes bacterium]|nr:ABC transporter ATP-binding protein [Planctomycetota bacterium]
MILELKNLCIDYGRFRAVHELSLQFEGGAIGLLGPNGAGKSTMIRTVLGLLKPSSGEGKILGLDLRRDSVEIRRRVGYMCERDSYPPHLNAVQWLTLLGEISGLPERAARERAHECLWFAGLEEARYREVENFSVGMKQRVKLAAALVHGPELVFLDEPTNGLDPAGRRQMLDLCKSLHEKHGIHTILASHLLPDVEFVCSQVMVLFKGRLQAFGPIADLKRSEKKAYVVRATGSMERFVGALRERGAVATEPDRKGSIVEPPVGAGPEFIFETARSIETSVLEFSIFQRSLEDVFMESLRAGEAMGQVIRKAMDAPPVIRTAGEVK